MQAAEAHIIVPCVPFNWVAPDCGSQATQLAIAGGSWPGTSCSPSNPACKPHLHP